MNYLSLYRKYRPKCFADVVGQKYIVTILKNAIKYNKIANAYIFAGIKGTGKTSIAKIFANAINCLHNNDGDVCKMCEICKYFANNNQIDVVELDAASNNGVDEIRQINDSVQFLPTKLSKKVYIIDEALIEEKPVNISYSKNIVIFSLVALVIILGIFFLVYYFDNTIKSSETINKLTGFPVLATIPKLNEKKNKNKKEGTELVEKKGGKKHDKK